MSGSPAPEDCVVRALIDRRAREHPDRTFVLFEDGEAWTYGELRTRVAAWAAGLQALGVGQGDFVLSWQFNGREALLTFFALNYLGAISVPINTAYKGGLLQHVIHNSGAALMVADGRLTDRLNDVDTGRLRTLVSMGEALSPPAHLALVPQSVLAEATGEPAPPERPIQPWDGNLVLYTSGTTGPSKGVLCSYTHSWSNTHGFQHHTSEDRHLVPLPLFHTTGAVTTYSALVRGGSVVLVDGFDTRRFWEVVRRFEVTTTGLLGVMMQFLLKQPPGPGDRDHSLKTVLIAPVDADTPRFCERFGVRAFTLFNMTEISIPIFGADPQTPGLCGRQRAGVELRLVDEHDIEVPEGQAGELILRTDTPWSVSHGYLNNPAATAATWRNGWFHTGDTFRRTAEGDYYFLDRQKDFVRRRGENISSFEVESEIGTHPRVAEVAVIGAPSPLGEDEVMAVIAPAPGAVIDPVELIDYLRPRLAHFMIPRYIRTLPVLPKTPTHKVMKHVLRAEGLTADTWDRDAAGVVVKRDRLAPAGG